MEKYDPKDEVTPNFNGLGVYVLPGANYALTVAMFIQFGFYLTDEYANADLVCFTGGTDVNPDLYGEESIMGQNFDRRRDIIEGKVFKHCVEFNIPMIGICRGSQFLAVMNGMKLWQDVNNHTRSHNIYDINRDVQVFASSTHHQMVRYDVQDEDTPDDFTLIALTPESLATVYACEDRTITPSESDPYLETEAYMFENTKCLGIQGHPEFPEYEDFRHWAMVTLFDFLMTVADEDTTAQMRKNEVPLLTTTTIIKETE